MKLGPVTHLTKEHVNAPPPKQYDNSVMWASCDVIVIFSI